MKKNSITALSACVILGLMHFSQPARSLVFGASEADENPTTIFTAVNEGLVTAEFRSLGGGRGEVIQLTITRQSDDSKTPLDVTIPAGTVLHSIKADKADTVVASFRDATSKDGTSQPVSTIQLTDYRPHVYLLKVYCSADAPVEAIPVAGMRFELWHIDKDATQTFEYVTMNPMSDILIQAYLWLMQPSTSATDSVPTQLPMTKEAWLKLRHEFAQTKLSHMRRGQVGFSSGSRVCGLPPVPPPIGWRQLHNVELRDRFASFVALTGARMDVDFARGFLPKAAGKPGFMLIGTVYPLTVNASEMSGALKKIVQGWQAKPTGKDLKITSRPTILSAGKVPGARIDYEDGAGTEHSKRTLIVSQDPEVDDNILVIYVVWPPKMDPKGIETTINDLTNLR